ncbi:MAG: Fe-Mn family superoxide dismutase [Candidatus Pacebacteria bacterium]|nr:Fe-Mn family superoxide dismutase [Candidatus Paceibacterota bacterium]MDR3583115.1 Fe-Mn family superoxide dismutase [Candidatus Paceibacterota bacterium]
MYTKNDYAHLKGMPGFSDQALDLHFGLYEGYVNNTNKILEKLETTDKSSPEYAELKRRLGWEFDGMRLHEYYFGALGGDGQLNGESGLVKALEKYFGSFEKWKEDFTATGKMRGIGWAALYQDVEAGRLINFWINEHNEGHPAGANPILVMDVFEHAYVPDYGTNRGGYIEAFMKNIDWNIIEGRLRA